MSKASEVATAIAVRMAQISMASGYATDIGARVYRGRRKLDESCVPCSILLEGDDGPMSQQGTDVKLKQKYLLEGHATCDPNNPNDIGLGIVADLKRAVFTEEELPGCFSGIKYLGRAIQPREDGLGIVAASIEIEVSFAEDLSSP